MQRQRLRTVWVGHRKTLRLLVGLALGLGLPSACSKGGSHTSGEPASAGGTSGGCGDECGEGATGATARAGAGSSADYERLGVCGQRGRGTVDAGAFEAVEEFYLIGEEGLGEELCVVRFDARRVGDAPDDCSGLGASASCSWAHRVGFDNPRIVSDVDGVCAASELGFDDARIAAIDGSEQAYGFVSEYVGHASVLLRYDQGAGTWGAFATATWDEGDGAFRFDRRNGYCGY